MSLKIAFYKASTGTFVDKLISWWTRGPYSHCELVFDDNPKGESECFSASYRDGGVRFKYIDLRDDKWELVSVNGLTDDDIRQIRNFCLHQRGLAYDFRGLLGFVAPPIHGEKDKWFCSEVIAAALKWAPEPDQVSPNDLYRIAQLRLSLYTINTIPARSITCGSLAVGSIPSISLSLWRPNDA